MLAKYHTGGDLDHPLISFEFNEIKEAIALESEANRISWLDLFRTPGNLRRMRIIVRSIVPGTSNVADQELFLNRLALACSLNGLETVLSPTT